MSYEVAKDDTGTQILTLSVDLPDGHYIVYTALDIAYTLAQNYREALISDNVYLSKSFPLTCLGFQVEGAGTIPEKMQKSGVTYYFDADGTFYFENDKKPNPDRAVEDFLALREAGKVVFGPSCAILDTTATHVHMSKGMGGVVTLYLYSE